MDVLQLIEERSSYRGRYEDTAVPEEDLRQIMEAGLAAPSGCNQQTTSLIAINDPELLSKVKSLTRLPQCTSAPAFICVLTQKTIAYRGKSFHIQDYSATIENMLLAITALGYQSCWIEGQITDDANIGRQIAETLNVPRDYELVCLLPEGKAAEPLKKANKKPFAERAWFNGFRQ